MSSKIFPHPKEIKQLYASGLSMSDLARKFGVSIDAVVYFMRKNKLPRRTMGEANRKLFEKKKPSFESKNNLSGHDRKLQIAGAMLYWAEGYKTDKAAGIDFANSNPEMVKVFLRFLRSSYTLDESRFRILLYCYNNQDPKRLIRFWSRLTQIEPAQFSKPYIKLFVGGTGGRQMTHGLIHVRYSDKKLLHSVLGLIEHLKEDFCAGGRAVNYSGL